MHIQQKNVKKLFIRDYFSFPDSMSIYLILRLNYVQFYECTIFVMYVLVPVSTYDVTMTNMQDHVIYEFILTHIPRIHKMVSSTPQHHSRKKKQIIIKKNPLFKDKKRAKHDTKDSSVKYLLFSCMFSIRTRLFCSSRDDLPLIWPCVYNPWQWTVCSFILYRIDLSSNSRCFHSVISRVTGCNLLNSVNDTVYLRFFRDLSSSTSNIHKLTEATVKSASFSCNIQRFSVHSLVSDDKSDCHIVTATDNNRYSSIVIKDTLQLHMRDQNNKTKTINPSIATKSSQF